MHIRCKKVISVILASTILFLAACGAAQQPPPIVEETPPPQINEEAAIAPEDLAEVEPIEPAEPSEDDFEELEPDESAGLEHFDVWCFSNFESIRQPLHLSSETARGDVSMEHLVFMSDNLRNRAAFSYQELDAAVWIVEELLAIGFAWEDIQVQEFTQSETSQWVWDGTLLALKQAGQAEGIEFRQLSQNIILTIPGRSEQTIIVTAHYDSWTTPGASDNASSMALLLESAQRMLYIDNYYTLVYGFFGAHEIGRVGANYYFQSLSAEQRENILFMLSADILLGTHFIYKAGFIEDNAHAENNVSMKIHEVADNLRMRYDIDLITFDLRPHAGGDELVFAEKGHTVVGLIALNIDEYGNFFGYYAHTEFDCVHHYNEIMPGMMERAMWFFSIFLEMILLAEY